MSKYFSETIIPPIVRGVVIPKSTISPLEKHTKPITDFVAEQLYCGMRKQWVSLGACPTCHMKNLSIGDIMETMVGCTGG